MEKPLGYPLGAPHDAPLQTRIILAALDLLSQPVDEPLIREFREDG